MRSLPLLSTPPAGSGVSGGVSPGPEVAELTAGVRGREAAVVERLGSLEGLVVAFSGGVDSSYLLALGVQALGSRCIAATAVSPSLAASELDGARAFAAGLGVEHVLVETHEGERDGYVRNDGDRCYHCKAELFERLEPLLHRFPAIAVGTIADDLGDHRPGQRAAAARGVLTPLADAGLTKAEVRTLSRARGLATWDAPAQACLASRIAYGVEVTPERLGRVERAEAWLRGQGFRELRVRDHGGLARVEVAVADLPRLTALAAELDAALREFGFTFVTIDAAGLRSGSLNALLAD